jgi:hypothetical protein
MTAALHSKASGTAARRSSFRTIVRIAFASCVAVVVIPFVVWIIGLVATILFLGGWTFGFGGDQADIHTWQASPEVQLTKYVLILLLLVAEVVFIIRARRHLTR